MPIAFIVEGQMEKRIVQRICAGKKVTLLGTNGVDVSVEQIVKRAVTQIQLLKDSYFPIILLIDREGRSETASELRRGIVKALETQGIAKDIIVSVPDRMIENWIIAGSTDIEECESRNGKSVLSRHLRTRGEFYHETTVGVDLFCSIDPKRARSRSASFRAFASDVEPFCPWLRRIGSKVVKRGS
jgi:Domain of unknown function (DUF4276)